MPVGATVIGIVIAAVGARRGRAAAATVDIDADAMSSLRADAIALRADAEALQDRLDARRGGADPGSGAR